MPLFASDRIRDEWVSGQLWPLARLLTRELCLLALHSDWTPLLTCIYRTFEEDREIGGSALHCYWRAVDVRTRDVDEATVAHCTDALNERWVYDPERPRLVVALSKPHGTGPHLHLQVHARTRLRAG